MFSKRSIKHTKWRYQNRKKTWLFKEVLNTSRRAHHMFFLRTAQDSEYFQSEKFHRSTQDLTEQKKCHKYLSKVDPGTLGATCEETKGSRPSKDAAGCGLESNPVYNRCSIHSFARFHHAESKTSPSHRFCPHYCRIVYSGWFLAMADGRQHTNFPWSWETLRVVHRAAVDIVWRRSGEVNLSVLRKTPWCQKNDDC